jgi:hypothetical protein
MLFSLLALFRHTHLTTPSPPKCLTCNQSSHLHAKHLGLRNLECMDGTCHSSVAVSDAASRDAGESCIWVLLYHVSVGNPFHDRRRCGRYPRASGRRGGRNAGGQVPSRISGYSWSEGVGRATGEEESESEIAANHVSINPLVVFVCCISSSGDVVLRRLPHDVLTCSLHGAVTFSDPILSILIVPLACFVLPSSPGVSWRRGIGGARGGGGWERADERGGGGRETSRVSDKQSSPLSGSCLTVMLCLACESHWTECWSAVCSACAGGGVAWIADACQCKNGSGDAIFVGHLKEGEECIMEKRGRRRVWMGEERERWKS